MGNFISKEKHSESENSVEIRGLITCDTGENQTPFLIWDISDQSLGLWSSTKLEENQAVTLTFSQPFVLVVTAQVEWCEKQSQNHGFRIGLTLNEESTKKLINITKSLEKLKPNTD